MILKTTSEKLECPAEVRETPVRYFRVLDEGHKNITNRLTRTAVSLLPLNKELEEVAKEPLPVAETEGFDDIDAPNKDDCKVIFSRSTGQERLNQFIT